MAIIDNFPQWIKDLYDLAESNPNDNYSYEDVRTINRVHEFYMREDLLNGFGNAFYNKLENGLLIRVDPTTVRFKQDGISLVTIDEEGNIVLDPIFEYEYVSDNTIVRTIVETLPPPEL